MSGAVEEGPSHPWSLEPGARVGRWRVVGQLGSGGHGVVYQVEEVDRPGETYALKLALRPLDVRAEREVELLARLEYHRLVRVHDWGRWPGVGGSYLYFVMDQVRGLPLHTWVETVNPPLRELVRVGISLALTLSWLHSRGVHHRDLKPEHILIRSSDSEPVLIDFGVGRQEGAVTLTSTVVPPGTLHLRSPEAVDFHRLHYHTAGARYAFEPTDDLYALGVCLFRALTGHYPFPPDLPGDLLALAILSHVPPPVTSINRRVPPAFSQVVARLLEKEPQARYGTGLQLYQALQAALELGPPRAWDETVFAWEAGPEGGAVERRARVPEWRTVTATPPPEHEQGAGRRRFSGAVMFVPVEDANAPGRTLGRRDGGRKLRGAWLARQAVVACVVVAVVALLAWLAARVVSGESASGARRAASGPVAGGAVVPPWVGQARPPPEECPRHALEAMNRLQVGKGGDSTYEVRHPDFQGDPLLIREGPVVLALDRQMGTLPRRETTVSGRFFFAGGLVHGWFTEARTKDGRSFPICMELLDDAGNRGWAPEGAGDAPDTLLVRPLGQVGPVKRFE